MLLSEQCILGIEASGFAVSVGIKDSGIAKGLICINDGSPGSEILLATIDQLLTTLKMEKTELQGVCLTLGPGAFTSLRISLAVAESLGLGLNIPVYGVDTLQLIAGTVPFYSAPIKVIQNAYKGEFYTATFETKSGKPELLDSIRLVKPDAFFDALQPNDLVLGTGVEILIQKDLDPTKKQANHNSDFQRTVSAIAVIEHFENEEAKQPSPIPLEPIYIRPSDAEINYNKQFGVNTET